MGETASLPKPDNKQISERLYSIALLLTVLFPVFFVAGTALTDICGSLVAILFLANSVVTKDFSWLKKGWVRVGIMLWLYISVSSLFADLPAHSLRKSLPSLRFFVFGAAVAYWVLRDKKAINYLLISMTAMVIFMAFDSFFQYMTRVDIFGREADYANRLTGPFSTPRVGAGILYFIFPAIAYSLERLNISKNLKNILILLSVLTGFFAIFLSGERNSLIIALFGCGIFMLFFRNFKITIPLMIAFLLGSYAIDTFMADGEKRSSMIKRQVVLAYDIISNYLDSSYGKIVIDSMTLWQKEPVFGTKMKNFVHKCELHRDEMLEFCHDHSHNIYVEMLTEAGVIGLVLFLLMWILLAREFFANNFWQLTLSHTIFMSAIVTIFIRLWPLAQTTSFFRSTSAFPLFIIIGLALAYLHLKQKEGKQQ